jgi:hypothetical protein
MTRFACLADLPIHNKHPLKPTAGVGLHGRVILPFPAKLEKTLPLVLCRI